MDTKTLNEICSESRTVVQQAADFIRANRYNVTAEDISEKGRNSLVSFVDRQSEDLLVGGLSRLLPHAGFITEEEMVEQSESGLVWIIDPLDGTTNFLHNIPCYSVSVALFDGQRLLMGIVHDAATGEVYHAVNGGGAFLNDRVLKVTDRADFHDILVGTGFPYKTEHTTSGHFEALKQVLHTTRGIRRLGSAAIDLCYVACGRFGAFYENTLNSYDIAAGALIVKEAGGFVSDFKGGENWLFEGEIAATAPQFKNEILNILKAF
jgi:myo-inositol-1(or 4)-monophosphatase